MSALMAALVEHAKAALHNAHAPYSHFPVGAAIQSGTGKIYSGCNVENACYAMCQCAEASAIGNMVTHGDQKIARLLLISKAPQPIFPCGGCLQKIAEFALPDTLIISRTLQGEQQQWQFSELFPLHFDKSFLAL